MTVAIVLLVMMSAYFSATETAFTSFNKIRMKNLAADTEMRESIGKTTAGSADVK